MFVTSKKCLSKSLYDLSMQLPCAPQHSKLIEFRRDGKFSDVSIQVEEEVFKCHRVILASGCPYFEAMFSGYFKERYTDVIILHDMNAVIFENILEFMYSGQLPRITKDNVYLLLRTANFLRIREIEELCIEFISNNIRVVENLSEIFSLMCAVNMDDFLTDSVREYIVRHFGTLSENEAFLSLSTYALGVIVEQYQSSVPDLLPFKVGTASRLLDFVVRWVLYARDERKLYFEEMTKMIDFKNVPAERVKYLSKIYKIEYDELSSDALSVKRDFTENLMSNDGYKSDDVASLVSRDLHAPTFGSALHLQIKRDDKVTTFSLSVDKPRWSVSCTLNFQKCPNYKWNMRSVSLPKDEPDRLYCLEIPTSDSASQAFHAYSSIDVCSSIPLVLSKPPVHLRSFDMCGIDTSVYVYNNGVKMNDSKNPAWSVEQLCQGILSYNTELDKWSHTPQMKIPMRCSGMTVSEDMIYLIGGLSSTNYVFDLKGYVQVYDHRAPAWFELPRTKKWYVHGNCCTVSGKIYVSDDFYTVEVFDTVAGKWYDIDNPISRDIYKREQMISYGNMLWLISCIEIFNTNRSSYSVVIFDPLSHKWCESMLLNEAIEEFSAPRAPYNLAAPNYGPTSPSYSPSSPSYISPYPLLYSPFSKSSLAFSSRFATQIINAIEFKSLESSHILWT